MDRRTFLRLGAAAAALRPARLLADPYAPEPARLGRPTPVRIRGRVTASGRGLQGVAVSDGAAVTATDASGAYELVSDVGRAFVSVSTPAGHRIPVSPTGTARFFQPIRANARGEMSASWDLEPLPSSDAAHTALILADPQTQDRQEMTWFHETTVPDVAGTVAGLGDREVFGVACGDIMFDDLTLYPDYEEAVRRMGVPFFQVVGNHDLDLAERTDEASTTTFCGRFGPRYYSFERGAAHYVVLDDVFWHGDGYIGYLGQDQLAWLENDLARVEAGRLVIVATHIPALGGRHVREGSASPDHSVAITNRQSLYRLLEPYQAHVLTGHTHENEHLFEGGVHEHVHGTACGAWWSGPICWDGTPSGYSVYDVDGESVSWRYKSTGFGADHQMRLYRPGSDPERPTHVVANVWDWDPEWRVVWQEDGAPRGPMVRHTGLDPLSVTLHTGPDLPPRRPWVDPVPVAHLFYAEPAPGTREITVEATDRTGRVYAESLSL